MCVQGMEGEEDGKLGSNGEGARFLHFFAFCLLSFSFVLVLVFLTCHPLCTVGVMHGSFNVQG